MTATRILMVEDDENLGEAVAVALAARGIDVTWAKSLEAAREVYEVDAFDVILTDYQLPDGTGLDFLASVRGSDKAVTMLWSGFDRTREIEASRLHIDHVFAKDQPSRLIGLLEQL